MPLPPVPIASRQVHCGLDVLTTSELFAVKVVNVTLRCAFLGLLFVIMHSASGGISHSLSAAHLPAGLAFMKAAGNEQLAASGLTNCMATHNLLSVRRH